MNQQAQELSVKVTGPRFNTEMRKQRRRCTINEMTTRNGFSPPEQLSILPFFPIRRPVTCLAKPHGLQVSVGIPIANPAPEGPQPSHAALFRRSIVFIARRYLTYPII